MTTTPNSSSASISSSPHLSSSSASEISESEHGGDSARNTSLMEPIAITGFSLKFPGDADSVESFWDMMMEGRCTATEFSDQRMNHAAHYSSDPGAMGTVILPRSIPIGADLVIGSPDESTFLEGRFSSL
jgi:hypothetical protein